MPAPPPESDAAIVTTVTGRRRSRASGEDLRLERSLPRLSIESGSHAGAARLAAATAQQRAYKSEHSYSLEEFGISRSWLRDRIPEVYDEFGYDL